MKVINFFQDFPVWLDEQIFLLSDYEKFEAGEGLDKNEEEIGEMNELEKKVYNLLFLQEQKKFSLAEEINVVQGKCNEAIRGLFPNSGIKSVQDLFEPKSRTEDEAQDEDELLEPELSAQEIALLVEDVLKPYHNEILKLTKECLELNWLQQKLWSFLDLITSLRLSYFSDFDYIAGYKLCAVIGSSEPSEERLIKEVVGLYTDEIPDQASADKEEEDSEKDKIKMVKYEYHSTQDPGLN